MNYSSIKLLCVGVFALWGCLPLAAGPIEQAYDMMDDGDYAGAAQLLARASNRQPGLAEDVDFYIAWGNAYLGLAAGDGPEEEGVDELTRVEFSVMAWRIFQRGGEVAESQRVQDRRNEAGAMQAQDAISQAAVRAREAEDWETLLAVSEAMQEVSARDRIGYLLQAEAADHLNRAEPKLAAYRGLVGLGLAEPSYYIYAARIETFLEEGGGLEMGLAHILSGREVMPDDLSLSYEHASHLIQLGRGDDAAQVVQTYADALEETEDVAARAVHLGAVGSLYDQLGDTDAAEQYYLSAIDLKPDAFEVRFNLGALYMSRAVAQMKRKHELPLDAPPQAYDALQEEIDASLGLAKTQFEYLQEHGPTDIMVLFALRDIYAQTNEMDAFAEVNSRIRRLQRGEQPED